MTTNAYMARESAVNTINTDAIPARLEGQPE
jgi:hypothetical protein